MHVFIKLQACLSAASLAGFAALEGSYASAPGTRSMEASAAASTDSLHIRNQPFTLVLPTRSPLKQVTKRRTYPEISSSSNLCAGT